MLLVSGYDGVNPNNNPVCGTKITATCKFIRAEWDIRPQLRPQGLLTIVFCVSDQGKSVTTTVTDRCEGCQETDLDFSPAAFSQLAALSVGRLDDMSWSWA